MGLPNLEELWRGLIGDERCKDCGHWIKKCQYHLCAECGVERLTKLMAEEDVQKITERKKAEARKVVPKKRTRRWGES